MKSVLLCLAGLLVSCVGVSSQERHQALRVYSDPAVLAAELRGLRADLDQGRGAKLNLPRSWEVQTSQGSFSISTTPLKELLEKNAGKDSALAWLDHLSMQLSGFGSAAPTGVKNSRVILNGILARREFAGDGPPTAWNLFWDRVDGWIKQQIQRLFTFAGLHPAVSWVLFWLVVLGAVSMLAFLLIRWWSSEKGLPGLPESSAALSVRTWEEWIFAARRAADGGDLRRGIQCAYWAGIARLQELGSLPRDLTRTPREYLRFLSGSEAPRSGIFEPIASLTSHLERFWYARLAARAEDFSACLASLEALGCRVH